MADLRALLDVPMDSVKAPAKWPAGTYHGFVEKYDFGESREKKTPYIRFFIKYTRADESIPADMLVDGEGKPLDMAKGPGGRARYKDFYITDDSKFILVEFMKSVGIDTEGKSISGGLPETTGKSVLVDLLLKSVQGATGEMTLVSEVGNLKGEAA